MVLPDTIGPDQPGVYVLANDHAADWLLACLASLRRTNPLLPVYIIPFDDETQEAHRIATAFGAGWFDSPHLSWLDEIGQGFSPGSHPRSHMFRKLSVFWGPLATFLYLDADTVALGPLTPILDAQADAGGVLFGDMDASQCFRGDLLGKMQGRQAHGNAGVFCAARGTLTPPMIASLSRDALSVREDFTENTDQAFLNFCLDRLGQRCLRLDVACPGLASSTWAAWTTTEGGGGFSLAGETEGRLAVLHWAGLSMDAEMPNRSLWTGFYDQGREMMEGQLPT